MLPLRSVSWNRTNWVCSLCRGVNKNLPRPDRRLHTGTLSSRQERKLNSQLPKTPARTRFAPSPTGFLHLGSLRTALYNYLLAKATGGQFLLRIEDTDAPRTVPGAEEQICRDLEWAGLQWDEGPKVGGSYGPYRQSERTSLYKEHAEKLIETRSAYRCFCSKERLAKLAREASFLGEANYNDSICMSIPYDESFERASKGEAYVIRLKTPAVLPEYKDLVYGRVGKSQKPNQAAALKERLENPILIKTDGLPTYHLANVVDDHHMKITHVIRGIEWMSATPKHLELYRVFGWEPPAFAHVGLLQDTSRHKLSKRELSPDLGVMKRNGIFPEALLNFVALLGWSHTRGTDVMTIQQLIESFDLKFSRGGVVINFPKLDYLQKQHFQRYVNEGGEKFEAIVDQLLELVKESTKSEVISDAPNGRTMREFVVALLRADKISQSTPKEFFERHKYLLGIKGSEPYKAEHRLQDIALAEVDLLANAAQQLADMPESEWSSTILKDKVATIVEGLSEMARREPEGKRWLVDKKETSDTFLAWLRWAIVDGQPGLGMFKVMELLGRSVTLDKLSTAYGLWAESRDNPPRSAISDPV